MSRDYLECAHCGGEAIHADPSGLYYQDDGETCGECGYPGHVEVDETQENPEAYWVCEWDKPGAKCNSARCGDCKP